MRENANVLNIEIKPYLSGHQDQIIELVFRILAEFNLPLTVKNQPDLNQIPQFYQIGQGNFWVAFVDNRVVGTIALVDIGNNQAALRKMFVDKDYRGKEKNIAQSLLNTLLTWSKQKGINEIYLGTQSIFLAAHRFYEKNGFVEISKRMLPKAFPANLVDSKFYAFYFSEAT